MERPVRGDLRPEDEIIVICVRTVLHPRQQQRLQALASGEIDWEGLLDHALRHRVAPLLYRNLRDACLTLPPPAVLERLRQVCAAMEQRNLLLAMELVRLVRLFGALGIAVIPFKGPLLATALYGPWRCDRSATWICWSIVTTRPGHTACCLPRATAPWALAGGPWSACSTTAASTSMTLASCTWRCIGIWRTARSRCHSIRRTSGSDGSGYHFPAAPWPLWTRPTCCECSASTARSTGGTC